MRIQHSAQRKPNCCGADMCKNHFFGKSQKIHLIHELFLLLVVYIETQNQLLLPYRYLSLYALTIS